MQGQWHLVYFGFTHCPDICPTTLLVIQNALNAMDPDYADQITPLLISVDPERDTVETLATYVSHFHPRLIGLTGTAKQVKQAADAYKVYYQKVPLDDSAIGYVVDHSGFIFLMNPQGEYVSHFPHNISESELAEKLTLLIRSS